MNCTVCGAQVDSVALRPTIPADWEYRYASTLVWHFDPGTQERHHCRLKPRDHTAYSGPEEAVAPIPAPPVAEEQKAGWVSLG